MRVRFFFLRPKGWDEGTRKGPPNSTTLPLPLHAPTSFAVGTGGGGEVAEWPLAGVLRPSQNLHDITYHPIVYPGRTIVGGQAQRADNRRNLA